MAYECCINIGDSWKEVKKLQINIGDVWKTIFDRECSVSIAASPSGQQNIGTEITFTATPTNGGTSPSYQWKVNGSNVGTNSTTYVSSSLSNGDAVTCVLTSNFPSVVGSPATSNTITMDLVAPGKGYWAGGRNTSYANTNDIDGISFPNEAANNPSATLSVARTDTGGVSSSTRGYFGGGYSSTYTSEVDGIQYSDESAINPSMTLTVARYCAASLFSTTKGYWCGGSGGGSKEIDGIQYSDESSINPSAALKVNRYVASGPQSTSKGYICGGSSTLTEIESFTFSSEAVGDPSASLSTGVGNFPGECNSSTKGYILGGADSGALSVNKIQGLKFSDESIENPTATLNIARQGTSGVSSVIKGYIGGGFNVGGINTFTSDIEGILFSNESSINPSATLSVTRDWIGATQYSS